MPNATTQSPFLTVISLILLSYCTSLLSSLYSTSSSHSHALSMRALYQLYPITDLEGYFHISSCLKVN